MAATAPHGELLAHDVGELVGVSGNTIGQWARRGYIRSSQRETEPRVYSVEDVAEAALVTALLQRGVRRPEIRRAVERLRAEGMPWPLATSRVATVRERRHTRLLIHLDGGWHELSRRGWQRVVVPGPIEDVSVRLAGGPPAAEAA